MSDWWLLVSVSVLGKKRSHMWGIHNIVLTIAKAVLFGISLFIAASKLELKLRGQQCDDNIQYNII